MGQVSQLVPSPAWETLGLTCPLPMIVGTGPDGCPGSQLGHRTLPNTFLAATVDPLPPQWPKSTEPASVVRGHSPTPAPGPLPVEALLGLQLPLQTTPRAQGTPVGGADGAFLQRKYTNGQQTYKKILETSLVVQWLGSHLPMQRGRFDPWSESPPGWGPITGISTWTGWGGHPSCTSTE